MAEEYNLTQADIDAICGPEDRACLALLSQVYDTDDVSDVLSRLHFLAARIAILAGVSPEDFAAGVKHFWDEIVNELNQSPATHSK